MTTNCLMRPRESYKGRIYSTNVVGWEGVKHIGKRENGEKDFSEIIQQAIELGGYPEDQEPHEILVGFGHHSVLSDSDKIVAAVKAGKIRHFFLIGGCDGARPGRNYYTEFAKMVPKDCVILTLACGKYRFNKLDFGEVAGLPRLLDVGQAMMYILPYGRNRFSRCFWYRCKRIAFVVDRIMVRTKGCC